MLLSIKCFVCGKEIKKKTYLCYIKDLQGNLQTVACICEECLEAIKNVNKPILEWLKGGQNEKSKKKAVLD